MLFMLDNFRGKRDISHWGKKEKLKIYLSVVFTLAMCEYDVESMLVGRENSSIVELNIQLT